MGDNLWRRIIGMSGIDADVGVTMRENSNSSLFLRFSNREKWTESRNDARAPFIAKDEAAKVSVDVDRRTKWRSSGCEELRCRRLSVRGSVSGGPINNRTGIIISTRNSSWNGQLFLSPSVWWMDGWRLLFDCWNWHKDRLPPKFGIPIKWFCCVLCMSVVVLCCVVVFW